MVLRHRLAVEIGELAKGVSVGNPFVQFSIIPILHVLENQRTQDLLWRQPVATCVGVLQAAPQIALYAVNYRGVVVKEIRNRLQNRVKLQTLLDHLPVGETELSLGGDWHVSALCFF